ncbi:MAG TPA: DUF5682 family protein [Actinophytocola sp.]|uniref:DUF5682 family protein n=1 Tax=Actinophytocola sp. TaxID=1872138 RepID=UPI002DDD5AFD|nr:DUF5682 family protein [Actinophytocola sp.]HEV2778839.1 DUF5682 family protein [Actinophytocola sp.]
MTELLGIRHHGPGSARAVAAALRETEPDVVLIEGPPEADKLVELAGDPGMEPPVALLAYAVDDATRAAFWPFAVFSPEWQALRYALDAGVPVRFCDLPVAHQFAASGGGRSSLTADPLAKLAEAGGYDDPERWWDDVIEHRRDGAAPFSVIAEAMRALRDELPEAAKGIREQQREAYMRTTLRKARRDGFERIAVVCGAWHVPALTDPLPPAAHDQRVLKGLPKRKVACTWVPWTHSRLAAASGYGAGVTSPGWYHHLFSATDRVTTRWLTEVARVLRAEDLPVSSAHVIEAVRLADTLAALRDRPLAGLAEVTEATRSVLCGGNDVLLDLVTRRLVVGERMGAMPDRTPQAPVAADLHAQARRLRLRRDPEERELDLDLRNPSGAERSQLLHRLRVLDIPWGTPSTSARRNMGTFRETWTLCWQPEFEVDLVAASAHGTTVRAAANAVIRTRALAATVLAETTAAVEQCLLAGLLDALPDVLSALDTRSARDVDVASLMAALPALARAARYGDVRGTDTASLRAVAERMLARIYAGLPAAARGLDEEAAVELCQHVDAVHEASALLGPDAHSRWLDALSGMVAREGLAPLLAGRMTRILADASRMDAGEVAARLGRALTPGVEPARGAAYIEGFFAGGALLLVHDERLLRVMDEWLAAVPAATFTEVLPLLRRTFGSFATPERRAIGERARELTVQSGAQGSSVDSVDVKRAEAALPVVAQLLGVGSGG